MMKHFWKWLALFAYRRWAKGCPTRHPPDGLPGIRDRNSRCVVFEPRPRERGDFGDCNGDGHYLCQECCHLKLSRRHDYVPKDDDEED